WRRWYRFPRCGSVRSRRLGPASPRAGRRDRATRHRRFRWRTGSAGRRSRYGRADWPLDAEYGAPHRPGENPCHRIICWPGPRPIDFRPLAGLGGTAMELFTQLFGDLLAFVYHCFDRIVIYGYLSGLSRPEQVVHFFRNVVGVAAVSKEVLSQRTADYQAWVEAFARNHRLPIEWAEKGVRKEDHVLPWQRRMARQRRLLYLQEHGAGCELSRQRAEIRQQRPQLPHPRSAAQPVHPLLFLHP